ncbi:hypothetical protein [Dialister invisus]|uniref:hypothetical protein n=1 Tax=Dialister invisus TaxID=218538 RepID=UPI00307C9224
MGRCSAYFCRTVRAKELVIDRMGKEVFTHNNLTPSRKTGTTHEKNLCGKIREHR